MVGLPSRHRQALENFTVNELYRLHDKRSHDGMGRGLQRVFFVVTKAQTDIFNVCHDTSKGSQI